MVLPGLYSVIVPLPSVVVVVVVVSETCAQANGATTANVRLSSIVFIVLFPCFPAGRTFQPGSFPGSGTVPSFIHHVIGRSPSCGRQSNGIHRFRALQRRISWIHCLNSRSK